MGRAIVPGSTDQTTTIRIMTTSGAVKTDVNQSSGINLYYLRPGSAKVAIAETDLAAEDSAHSDGGLYHIDGGNYRLDLPDAAVAAGADEVQIIGSLTDAVVFGQVHPLNVARVDQLSTLDKYTYKGTITSATDGQNFSADITDRDGTEITDSEMVSGALNGKSIMITSTESSSGTSPADSAIISACTYATGNTWDFVLDPVFKLVGTPDVGDEFLIGAF